MTFKHLLTCLNSASQCFTELGKALLFVCFLSEVTQLPYLLQFKCFGVSKFLFLLLLFLKKLLLLFSKVKRNRILDMSILE